MNNKVSYVSLIVKFPRSSEGPIAPLLTGKGA